MRLKVKLWVENENQKLIFGDGKNEVLRYVDETNSLSKTAELLNMTEEKVMSHLEILENHHKEELVLKVQGLKKDSKASYKLTPEAREILQTYSIYQYDVKKFAEKKFEDMIDLFKIKNK